MASVREERRGAGDAVWCGEAGLVCAAWARQGEGGEGNTARASTWGGPRGEEKGQRAHWATVERGSRPKTRESEREK